MLTAAHAASFDCGKATSSVEKMICADPGLSRLDEALAAVYSRARTAAIDPAAMRQQQREWLADIRKRCSEAACLKAAYTSRIAQLAAETQQEFAVQVAHPSDVSGKRRFELAQVHCEFTLSDVWKRALSGRPYINGLPDVFIDSVQLVQLPRQKTCAVMVAGSELAHEGEEMHQASCPDPYDSFAIWHEVSGNIEPLFSERGWGGLYQVRDELDNHWYYLKVFRAIVVFQQRPS